MIPQKPIGRKYLVQRYAGSFAEGEFAHAVRCFASKPSAREYQVQRHAGNTDF